MDLKLSSKVAFISGSTSGLGLEIAQVLHDEGCFVILNGRTEHSIEVAMASFDGRVAGIVGDVTCSKTCEKIAKQISDRFLNLDVLVCNVGNGASVPPGHENEEEWHRLFAINFFSAVNLLSATKGLMQNRGASIVCISSICGVEVLGAPITYSCAKSALNHFVRGMARPLAKVGIRINAVAPGNLLFEGSIWEKKLASNADEVNEMLEREVSLSRFGLPEEIAKSVAFLCSSVSSFSTGQIYVIDGGQLRS